MKLRHLVFGIATYVPGVRLLRSKGTGGTDSARYCYSVWLRHLVLAKRNGLNQHPKIVAELGPGDSLGIGLAAIISGCDRYYAFDVVKHANTDRDLEIFDELVKLFKNKTDIPGSDEFPKVKPFLDDYSFPNDIMDEERLQKSLNTSRLKEIRAAIASNESNDSYIQYKVPWYEAGILRKDSVDMIYSQAVLEHVDDLENTYKAMYLWLKPDGYISHQIDFKCHGYAKEWNGHWRYSKFTWSLIRGKRPYLLNREPHSTHITLLKQEGFRIVCDTTIQSKSIFDKEDLASEFRSISDEDVTTSGAFIQAVKQT